MPYCPVCRLEYVEGVTECPDCEVELVSKLEPTEQEILGQEELVPVYYPKDETEAKIVKAALEGAGIPAWEKSDLVTSMFPFDVDSLGGDEIGVLASRIDDAKKVIKHALAEGAKMPVEEGPLSDEE